MTLRERFATLNATTSATAKEWARQNKQVKSRHFALSPLGAFLSSYLGQGKWRNGISGLTIALFDSYAVLVSYAKLWEIQNVRAEEILQPQGSPSIPSSHSNPAAASREACCAHIPSTMFAAFRPLTPPNGFTAHTTAATWWLKDGHRKALLAALEEIKVGRTDRLQGGRGIIERVPFDAHSPAIVRRYQRGGLVRHFVHDLYWGRPPRPFMELCTTVIARERGVPTVEVLGAGVEWRPFGFYRGTLITREARGFLNWRAWLQTNPPVEGRRLLVDKVLQTINTMHECGISHADLNLTNVLVRHDSDRYEVLIIDFDRARIFPSPLPSSQRKRNLARLRRSMAEFSAEGRWLEQGPAI